MKYENIYNIMDLVCYTNFHWFFNHESQHIIRKQMGIYFSLPKTITTWLTKIELIRNNKCIFYQIKFCFYTQNGGINKTKYYNSYFRHKH